LVPALSQQPGDTEVSVKATPSQCRPGLLVVEDEDFIREMLACLLEQQGFAVWQAANGLEAVELYRRQHRNIGVALLDMNLPDLDGTQVLAALRQINPSVRCCLMTGASHPAEEGWQDQGAERLFLKPFPLGEVATALRELTADLQPVG